MLRIRARINHTEDPEKVKRAVSNIFPLVKLEVRDGEMVGEGEDSEALLHFGELLREQIIRDAARAFLEHHRQGMTYRFGLNKQAALMGKVNFVDFDVALGTIDVETDELIF